MSNVFGGFTPGSFQTWQQRLAASTPSANGQNFWNLIPGASSVAPALEEQAANPGFWTKFPGAFQGFKSPGLALGIGAPLAGQFAGGAVENLGKPNTTGGDIWQAIGTGFKTAGAAAPVGAMFEGVGAIPAAIGGFGVGFTGSLAHSLFGGGGQQGPSADDLKALIGTTATQGQLDPATYQQRFDTYKKLGIQSTTTDAQGKTVGTGKAATDQEIAQRVISELSGDAQQKQAQQQDFANTYLTNQANAQYQLALQSQAQQFFSPYANAILASGMQGSQILKRLAATAPPGFSDAFNSQADMMANDALRTYGAYGMQIAAQPWVTAVNETAKQQAQASQNTLDQMRLLAAAQARQGSGNQTDFSQVTQPTPTG